MLFIEAIKGNIDFGSVIPLPGFYIFDSAQGVRLI